MATEKRRVKPKLQPKRHRERFKKVHKHVLMPSHPPKKARQPKQASKKSARGRARLTRIFGVPNKKVRKTQRASAEKGFRGRNVLDINILRLLGMKLPSMTGLDEPPADVGFCYGLTDEFGKHTHVMNDDAESKKRSANPNYRVFSSAQEAQAYADIAPGRKCIIFTDGSYFPRTHKTGYAVWWGQNHLNNAAGPVPPNLPLSSARAEEYAIFLALLQIKLEVQHAKSQACKYEIRTDSTWTIAYISKWFRKWDKANTTVGWKTPPSKSTRQRDVLRVSAGILWELRFSGAVVQFAYVPGHEGVEGNEMADSMARHAARSGETIGLRPVAF